jgi:hypothetical protein
MLYQTILSEFITRIRERYGPISQAFLDAILPKLDNGFKVYGDESFHKPFSYIMEQTGQEGLDLFGWPLIGYKIAKTLGDEQKMTNCLDLANTGIIVFEKTRTPKEA